MSGIEVTPDLLASVESYANDTAILSDGTRGVELNAHVVLALVKRIRELESDIEELYERARDEAWERDL